YAEETPAPVSRLKKHPAMLRVLEAQVAAEVDAARALLAERLGSLPGAAWVLTAWDGATKRSPSARPRSVRKQLEKASGHGLDVPPETAHAAEQALRRVSARLRDVRRILAEALTDRTRLEVLCAAGGVEPASQRDLEELVRWSSAQLDEALP